MSRTSILVVCASPHKGGTTETLARIIQDSLARETDKLAVTLLALSGKKLSGCLHCGSCKKDGFCSLRDKDDCEAVFSAMRKHSLVLWLSPVYFYGLPAQAKALVDRSQRFYEYPESRAHERAFGACGSRALSILVSGRKKGNMLFAGSHLALKYFFSALGITYKGSLALRGLEAPSDIGGETRQEIAHAARTLARCIATGTQDLASALQESCPLFGNAMPAQARDPYSNIQISQSFRQGMTR